MVRGWACSKASLKQAWGEGWPCPQAGVPGDWDGGISAGHPHAEVGTLGLGFGVGCEWSPASGPTARLWPRPRPAPTSVACFQAPSPGWQGCQ